MPASVSSRCRRLATTRTAPNRRCRSATPRSSVRTSSTRRAFSSCATATIRIPLSFDPTLVVQGAFTGGGSSQGISIGNQDHYELQNYTSIAHGKHFIKFGGRLRGTQYSSTQKCRIQWRLQLRIAECVPDHGEWDCRGTDSSADPRYGRRSQPVLAGCRRAVVRRLDARHRAVRRG